MLIVSDTSPLSYLVLIGEGNLLGALYEEVLIPPAVENELKDPDGSVAIRRWIEEPPSWLQVKATSSEERPEIAPETAEALHSLDRGEREAIRLAKESTARLLIIDERDGRRIARDLGLSIAGTLGVLDTAASEGLVDAPALPITSVRRPFGPPRSSTSGW